MNTQDSYSFFIWLFLHLLTVGECADRKVHGFAGNNVVLPCRYDAHYYKQLHMCWGRGEIPTSGCNNEIISTDGLKVTNRVSHRYQLLGDLQAGDISLTILSAKETDSGIYGCRVHIPGWFNDQKETVRLVIEKRPEPTTKTPVLPSNSTDQVPTGPWTPRNHTEGTAVANCTESSESLTPKNKEVARQQGPNMAVVLPVLLILLIVITALLLLMRKRWKKDREVLGISQWNDDTVLYMNTESGLGLDTRDIAQENIYQLDSREDYETCP
ncbi:hepatitis A virus cellular receptor 1 [Megalops cyprinoides]|uniref:hepatitis A virus cellular receptor 1 n=1 Tax=Megalops cyprinoides TaxID=118141 RepID=UPI001863FBEA|nr:hepatitis A virus cellular receptor 1 [Megalops cyprinoides]